DRLPALAPAGELDAPAIPPLGPALWPAPCAVVMPAADREPLAPDPLLAEVAVLNHEDGGACLLEAPDLLVVPRIAVPDQQRIAGRGPPVAVADLEARSPEAAAECLRAIVRPLRQQREGAGHPRSPSWASSAA